MQLKSDIISSSFWFVEFIEPEIKNVWNAAVAYRLVALLQAAYIRAGAANGAQLIWLHAYKM